jgi:hypothetical protein
MSRDTFKRLSRDGIGAGPAYPDRLRYVPFASQNVAHTFSMVGGYHGYLDALDAAVRLPIGFVLKLGQKAT